MKHHLTITPAIPPEQRHVLEDELKKIGYHVIGGGTMTDRSECDISFESTEESDKIRSEIRDKKKSSASK